MKYDLTTPLKSYDGKDIQTGETAGEVATLRFVLERACINADAQKHAAPDQKYKIYKLLRRVHAADPELELSAEDLTLLKQLVGELFGVNVVGVVYDLLEQAPSP